MSAAKHPPGPTLMQRARSACEAVASGPFTPIVLERYEWIGGERGWSLGYQSSTRDGWACIVWTNRAAIAKAEVQS